MLHLGAVIPNLTFAADAHYHHLVDDVIVGRQDARTAAGAIAGADGAGTRREARSRQARRSITSCSAARRISVRSGPASPGLGAARFRTRIGPIRSTRGSRGSPSDLNALVRPTVVSSGAALSHCRRSIAALLLFAAPAFGQRGAPPSEDGYDLWLRYRLVADASRLAEYRAAITSIVIEGDSPTLRAARDELSAGLTGLLGAPDSDRWNGRRRRSRHRRHAERLSGRRGRCRSTPSSRGSATKASCIRATTVRGSGPS